jgi:hypothetical protein
VRSIASFRNYERTLTRMVGNERSSAPVDCTALGSDFKCPLSLALVLAPVSPRFPGDWGR